MTEALLTAQVRLAMALPELANQIKALVLGSGVTEEQWEDKAHEMAMAPGTYFAEGTPQRSDGFSPLPD